MITILGGTFDPIHNGHLYIADAVYKELQPEKVLFMPAKQPPHRPEPITSVDDRAAMIELAIEPYPQFELCGIELERPGLSYTVDSIKTLRRTYEGEDLSLILGFDAYQTFQTWMHFEEILEFASLIVMNRNSDNKNLTHEENDLIDPKKITHLTLPPNHCSSTSIRTAVQTGQDLNTLVPETVANYIESHKLYRN